MIKTPKTGATDGEIDFVIAHPDEGILSLETMGGRLECDDRTWQPAGEG